MAFILTNYMIGEENRDMENRNLQSILQVNRSKDLTQMMSIKWGEVLSVAALLILCGSTSFAAPFGNPSAPQQGTFSVNLGNEPTTLNPITGTDAYNQEVQAYILDSLMDRNPDTYEWTPALAEKVEKSADGKSYTFTIRKNVKFHDGKPVTAEDIKFSFDVIFDPKYNAAHLRPYYENIEKAEILDPLTVRFTTKNKYFGNFDVVAGLSVLPKHFYGDADAGKKKNKTILGSGPYKLEKYDQSQSILLVKNKDWWGASVPEMKGRYNFEHIRMRFDKDENIAIEKLKKGELDYDGLTPEAYMKKTDGPEWGPGKVVIKEKVENKQPKNYGYIGWNLRKDLFKDRDVRLALFHLLNRDEMNKKFRFGMSIPATGPWYQQSEYANPNVKPIGYDPKKATDLLKKAGWTDSDKDGVLDKMVNGKKTNFQFTLIYGNPDNEKYWVLYQNDLKKVGIKMELQRLEWNAMLKNIDEASFDAAALAWGGGSVDVDPKQIWHSSSIGKGGSNFVGYSNPEVDKLIDEARGELDKAKRIPIDRKIYEKIAADVPYAFLFNDRFSLYAHGAKIKMKQPTYKYRVGTDYWWTETN
jgi:peptide/nickel transport system substrate-binding protein/microcin C transport system substrate-binding protein